MPRATPIQQNFAGGAVSPLLIGRIDLQKYATGVATLENFIVLPEGGVMRRRGTKHIAYTKDSSRKSRLIPFIFSQSVRYVLEFGDLYMRVYRDDVLQTVADVPYEVTTPYSHTELSSMYVAQTADVMYIAHPNHPIYKLARSGDTSWTLTKVEFVDGPYLDPNDDDSKTLSVEISSDTIELESTTNLFSPSSVGKLIEFKEDDIWRLGDVVEYTDAKHVKISGQAYYDRTLAPSMEIFTKFASESNAVEASGALFVPYMGGKYMKTTRESWWVKLLVTPETTASNAHYANVLTSLGFVFIAYSYPTTLVKRGKRKILGFLNANHNAFVATDVGRPIRLNFLGKQVWCVVTSFVSATRVGVEFKSSIPRDSLDVTQLSMNGTTSNFRLGAWSDTTGWPMVIAFHEQRLVAGRNTIRPQTFWFSETDDYESMSPTDANSSVLDTNAITYTLASPEVNEILWFSPGPALLIGTSGGEWQIHAASTIREPITARNINAEQQTPHGSVDGSIGRRVGSAVLFISRSAKTLYELTYSFEQDKFVSKNLCVFNRQILSAGGGAVELAYQEQPHSIVWARLLDGSLAACTYMREQEVLGWHRHTIASGNVESIVTVPIEDGSREALYLIVSDGVTRRIEKLDTEFDPINAQDRTQMQFFDGWRQADISSNAVSGLEYLNTRVVGVVVDGVDIGGNHIVLSGSVTIPEANVGNVVTGLRYISRLVTLPIEAGSATGTAQAKTGRVEKIALRLWNTGRFSYTHVDFPGQLVEESLDLSDSSFQGFFTGDRKFATDFSYSYRQQFEFQTDRGTPLNILAMMAELYVNE